MPLINSPEQREAISRLLSFAKTEQTLGGFAGTGKTTVLKTLSRSPLLENFAYCAYTGKAADVMARKGIPRTSTIHSRIYKPVKVERLNSNGKIHHDIEFVRRETWELECDGFVVDEASMVGPEIYKDLTSYGLPVIFVGDHGQLPPVAGNGFNLMANPDIRLETVFRNAGEILHFANFLRQGNPAREWTQHENCTGEAVHLVPFTEVEQPAWDDLSSQAIVGMNKHRVILNRLARETLELPAHIPVPGDRVICLQNDRKVGVFNGMQGRALDIDLKTNSMIFESNGRTFPVKYDPDQFNEEKSLAYNARGRIPFDYAYCISCHKAQGDEWDSVLVIEQSCRAWEQSRWAYTAASRAKKQLTWVPE